MSTDQTQTVTELNAQTDASLKARRAPAAKPATAPKPTATRKPVAKPAAKATPKAAAKAAPKVRKALTPQERAAKPVTATIAAYVEWLNATVYAGKMTARDRTVAGVSITLYGAFQISPERRAARGA